MKSARECQDRLPDLVTLAMGEADPRTARELQEHIALCVEHYGKKGSRSFVLMRDYLDYNKEFDPSVFHPETPKWYITVDQTKTKIGLEKGNLTDDQIATKVIREFLEAMIAGDFKKASPLYSGMPVDFLRKRSEK
ncbi:MAG: zf-HC2 domain-containing protein [Isosphaeraceae bacterium]